MNNKNCQYCKEKMEYCICSLIARFFKDNGHLMKDKNGLRREQNHKKRFFYVKGLNPLLSH